MLVLVFKFAVVVESAVETELIVVNVRVAKLYLCLSCSLRFDVCAWSC